MSRSGRELGVKQHCLHRDWAVLLERALDVVRAQHPEHPMTRCAVIGRTLGIVDGLSRVALFSLTWKIAHERCGREQKQLSRSRN